MNKKQKKMLIRIVIAAVLVVAFSLIPMKGYVKFVLFMIPSIWMNDIVLLFINELSEHHYNGGRILKNMNKKQKKY